MIAPLRVNLLLNNTRVNERDGLRTDGAHTRVLLYELVVYIYIYSVYILCIILLLASSTTLYGY